MRVLILFIALLLIAPTSFAESNGSSLLKKCNAALQFMDGEPSAEFEVVGDASFCLGLMQGIRATSQIHRIEFGEKTLFCEPETGIDNGQAARIVVKFLKEHPEMLHHNDSVLAIAALVKAYPCGGR